MSILISITVPLFFIVLFKGTQLFYELRKESKDMKSKINGYPKAAKPTRQQIKEMKEVDRLLELDEYPTIVRQINLDQHEKAIS